jgi:predicted CXXCH cytochrome family protein
MRSPFGAYDHLLRLAAVFALAFGAFALVRAWLVPADYGTLGSYRAAAITQNRVKPIVYAGQVACVDCHTDVADARKGNAHAAIGCESCHGPHAAHAEDPAVAARRPDPRSVCVSCHAASGAKPASFKTVNVADHADGGPCTACHPAHAPRTW